MKYLLSYCSLFLLLCSCTTDPAPAASPTSPDWMTMDADSTPIINGRWEADRAKTYYEAYGWQLGANYNPRNAINQLEMWQAETFSPEMIDEELGWAEDIGMNSMRVYLHNLVWEADSAAYLKRIEQYLDIADSHGISTSFVLFDAVWDPVSELGKQPEPRPHVHNSGWVQSPPARQLTTGSAYYPAGRSYIQGILRHFKDDDRIFMWDLYNEPDNHNFGKFPNEPEGKEDYVYDLMVQTFRWAREVNPSQPVTAGVWFGPLFNEVEANKPLNRFNAFQLANSDLISYHHYRDTTHHRQVLDRLQSFGRPLVCTEYVARTHGSDFLGTTPLLHAENVSAYNWGLVAGKTQTQYPWASWDSTFTAEPHLWHHEVFYPDGRAYDEGEVALLRRLGEE